MSGERLAVIYRSTDTGRHWVKVNDGTTFTQDVVADLTVVPTSAGAAYAYGSAPGVGLSVIATTDDGGHTWAKTYPAFGSGEDDGCAYYGGYSDARSGEISLVCRTAATPVLAQTRDDGKTWAAFALPGPPG